MSTRTPNFFFFPETPKFLRFPAFQWFYSFPLNKRELSLRKLEKLTVFWCLQLAEKWTTNEDVYIILLKKGLFILPALSILTPYQKSKSKPHDFWNSQGLGKRCYRGAMGFSEDCRMLAEITSSPPGCPENSFWGDKGSQQEKTDSLATSFFFFFRIRGGGSKWIHFQLRWVHYFVCLCGFSVGDLLLETGDSDEKKVWDQFVNLDFAKCKKIILWRRQSYLLNTLGCSPTQWPPGLLKHSWTMDTNYKTFTCWMSPSLTGYFEDHSRTCK